MTNEEYLERISKEPTTEMVKQGNGYRYIPKSILQKELLLLYNGHTKWEMMRETVSRNGLWGTGLLWYKHPVTGGEDAVKIQKLWVAKEKEVVGKITEVEAPLDAEIEVYENNQRRLIEEEKQRKEEAYMMRTQALTKMGALYSDGYFALGNVSMEANLVKESSNETWESEILPAFNVEYQKAESERIEQERVQKEKDDELKRQQEEFAQKQREFEAQQAEFKRQQDAIEAKRREDELAKEREEMTRRNKLQQKRFSLLMPVNPSGTDVNMSALWELSDEEFDTLLSSKTEKFKKEQAEKQKAIEEEAAKRERDRILEEQRISEQKKAEELAKAGDKAQWDNFIANINKIQLPTGKSGQYRRICAIAKDKIEEILNLKPLS